jgi:hypothetical protein
LPHRSRVTSREPIFGAAPALEHGFRVIDAGDDRPLIAQWAAKSHHQTSLISAHLKGLDIQSTPALHVAYLGRSGEQRVSSDQRPLQSYHHPRLHNPLALDTETHQFFSGQPLIARAIARMRGDGVKVTRTVDGDRLKVIQPPEVFVTRVRDGWLQGGAVDGATGLKLKQTQRPQFLILDDNEATVGELADSGRLIDAGQGLEAGDVVRKHVDYLR